MLQVLLLNSLQDPIPRNVFDYVLRSTMVEKIFAVLQERKYIRDISRHGHKPAYIEMDETMSHVRHSFNIVSCLNIKRSDIFEFCKMFAGWLDLCVHSYWNSGVRSMMFTNIWPLLKAHYYSNSIPSFHLRDNFVHFHECSPFWVGIFIIFNNENYHVYFFI